MLVQFGKFKLDKAFELNDNVGQIKVAQVLKEEENRLLRDYVFDNVLTQCLTVICFILIFYNATLSDTEGGSIDLVPMKRRKNLI